MYMNIYVIQPHMLHSIIIFHSRYEMMVKCWNKSPAMRPHFSELVSEISTSLEGMADYLELSTELQTADLTVSAGQDSTEQESNMCMADETVC